MQPDDNDQIDAVPSESQGFIEQPKTAEQVGFRRPPTSTRFRKGVSGNPKGRPKGSLNVGSVFVKALREKVVINEHGKRRTVTKLEAALKQLVNKAASGDRHSCQQLLDLARDAEARQDAANPKDSGLNDIDEEVLEGILKRFEASHLNTTETPDDSQSN